MEQTVRYQGYPYVNPRVTDAPSVDPATAYKYANLPRKQLHVNVNRPNRHEENQETEEETDERRVRPSIRKQSVELQPVVYIDVPDNGEIEDSPRTEERVAESREDNEESEEHNYVQETIFYDPFENRRIAQGSPTSSGSRPVNTPSSSRPVRPPPPATLDINSPGSSGYSTTTPGASFSSPNAGLPPSMSKEAYVYGCQPTSDDGFPLSPIPVSEFPEPPPAYSEYDRVASPQPSVIVEQPRPQPEVASVPPRTQVIVQQETPLPLNMNSSRKYLHCHHCGYRVLTLVIRETGAVTHVIALSFLMLCLFPVTIAIYCTKCCKYKNHYCPGCSKLIGYEVPVLCQKMVYVKE